MDAVSNGYVVTRPHPGSGIGSNLASLAGAVWTARRLGRTVIVDWRGSAFLKNQALNYFTEFFETVPQIQGVEVRYAPCDELPEPIADAAIEELTPGQMRDRIARGAQP